MDIKNEKDLKSVTKDAQDTFAILDEFKTPTTAQAASKQKSSINPLLAYWGLEAGVFVILCACGIYYLSRKIKKY